MIKLILAYLAGSSALFMAGFFCHAFLAGTRIKMETTRAEFWERKWNELVEIISARTDRTKDEEHP